MEFLNSLWDSVVTEAKKKSEDAADYTQDEPEGLDDETSETEDEPAPDNATDDASTDYTVEDDTIGGDDDTAGDEGTDYTADDDTENPDEGDTDAGDTGDADTGGDDGDTTDDATGDTDEEGPTLDTGEDEGGTDYTADAGDDTGDESSSEGGDDTSDSSGGDSEESSGDDDSSKNDKLRKYYLLKDFGELQAFIKDAVDKLTEKKRESFIDKQVDMQVVTNFNKLLGAISDYMVFKFDEDDYTTAYYNYKRYTILINMNMEILEKRKEYVEKNLKAKGQKKSK